MNERIKELEKQSVFYNEETEKWELNLEKFAELIVKECANFCDEIIKEAEIAMAQCEMVKTSDRLMMLHDGTINGAQMSKIRIKEHFGVESR